MEPHDRVNTWLEQCGCYVKQHFQYIGRVTGKVVGTGWEFISN